MAEAQRIKSDEQALEVARIFAEQIRSEEIRLIGTEAQKKFFFDRILKGERLGNAAVERSGKNVIAKPDSIGA